MFETRVSHWQQMNFNLQSLRWENIEDLIIASDPLARAYVSHDGKGKGRKG